MSELIDRDETIKQFCKQDCGCDPKDCLDKTCYEVEIIESVPTHPTPSNTLGALDCVERRLVSYKLTDLVNEFEEILSHIREREENDSVCGLCEYDGAYMGQSGDWYNECPGFDKADCFKLKDKYKKEWLELMNTLPSVQPEIIRCKDCKYWRQQTNYAGAPLSFGFCESDDMWRSLYGETTEVAHIDTDDNHYCSYAERRLTDG